jgi:hypothetical protein
LCKWSTLTRLSPRSQISASGPTVANPPIRVQWFPKRLDHHVFVVALEADQRDPHFLGRHQMIDDLAALRATVAKADREMDGNFMAGLVGTFPASDPVSATQP